MARPSPSGMRTLRPRPITARTGPACSPLPSTSKPPSLRRRPPSSTTRSLGRSEEHTSELQSLMRISYAVFCLKKKKTTNTLTNKNISHKQKKRTNQHLTIHEVNSDSHKHNTH